MPKVLGNGATYTHTVRYGHSADWQVSTAFAHPWFAGWGWLLDRGGLNWGLLGGNLNREHLCTLWPMEMGLAVAQGF